MSTPNICLTGSISKFLNVSNRSAGFAADDVINMKQEGAEKAGTFHDWNIFRRLGRSDNEIRDNNDTRQKFLDSLKKSFGLKESGKELVDRLGKILGKDVFKPKDYTFDKNGVLDSGKPLTARRIAAVSEKIIAMHSKWLAEKLAANDTNTCRAIDALTNSMSRLYTLSDTGKIPMATEREITSIYTTISNILTQLDERNSDLNKNRFVGFSAALRLAVDLLDRPSDEKDAIFNAIWEGMKSNARFTEAYDRHEKLINEHYSLLGTKRPENDGLGKTSTTMTVEVALNVLNLPATATMADVRKAYKILAAQNHPDKIAGLPEDQKKARTDLYTRIVGAYDFLKSEFDKGGFDKAHRRSAKAEPEHAKSQPPSDLTSLAIGNGDPDDERDFLARQAQTLIVKP